MLLLKSIIFLALCLPSQVLALPNLVKWADEDQPTWHAEFTLGPFDPKPATYEQVLSYAKQYYNQIKSDPKAMPENSLKKHGPLLVAALYIPGSTAANHKVYASTVPRGTRKTYMKDHRQEATAWYIQTKNLKSTNKDDVNIPFHAEDAAYFNFETLVPDSKRTRYPSGSILAVWGRFDGQADAGKEQLPCGAYPKRDPSCATVAHNIGVATGKGAAKRASVFNDEVARIVEGLESLSV
ncbi:uncharacterized protein UV8b_06989 [Ustilaginoidea virens]|uniref:Uncharacterized protein n=1 Tax=Ustilaginoidea virens TaxID=1159556 RepID=A0A063C8Q8_USTVR|nr:uncharacterized protein UV8b_06989 [Ustilaginoidea virens]QUC22748.1 hypothetical protein UV8b_06989 [Ustilaginoidea virens]GAO16501.1 hypothetical protein UVI_02010920 [Ustilaginoidea virens]